MTTQEAIEFLPLYAAADDSDYVRHYEPKQKQQKPRQMHRKAPETPFRMQLDEKMRKFIKRYGLTFLAWFGFTVWTVLACCITGAIVRNNTTIDVTARMETAFAERLAQMEQERKVQTFLTGEASKEAAITQDARMLANIGQGVMNTYSGADLEDAKKVMICAICRVFTGGEFAQVKSISDSVNMPGQWWGYSGTGISYTEDVYNTALEVSRIFHNSEPLPCASNMVYASWNGNDIVLRDKWQDNSSAKRY